METIEREVIKNENKKKESGNINLQPTNIVRPEELQEIFDANDKAINPFPRESLICILKNIDTTLPDRN